MTEIVALGARGIEVSPTSLTVTDTALSFDSFESAVRSAAIVGDSARWWLGDLLLFGEARYGERYAQALEASRMSERQLNEYRYVCERVARSRRREKLPFSYHRVVAALEPSDQELLLGRAEDDRWSREQLREAVRDRQALAPPAAGRTKQEVLSAGATVEAARNLSTVRRTLETVGGALEGDEAKDAVGLPAALRALDEVGKTVKTAAAHLSLSDAVERAVGAGVKQTGLADLAYIVPAEPWEALVAAFAKYGGSS